MSTREPSKPLLPPAGATPNELVAGPGAAEARADREARAKNHRAAEAAETATAERRARESRVRVRTRELFAYAMDRAVRDAPQWWWRLGLLGIGLGTAFTAWRRPADQAAPVRHPGPPPAPPTSYADASIAAYRAATNRWRADLREWKMGTQASAWWRSPYLGNALAFGAPLVAAGILVDSGRSRPVAPEAMSLDLYDRLVAEFGDDASTLALAQQCWRENAACWNAAALSAPALPLRSLAPVATEIAPHPVRAMLRAVARVRS